MQPGYGTYAASKAAVEAMTRILGNGMHDGDELERKVQDIHPKLHLAMCISLSLNYYTILHEIRMPCGVTHGW